MENFSVNAADYSPYAEYWNLNIEKIEEIQKNLDLELKELESLYPDFEEHYTRAQGLSHILSSIYSSINVIEGKDELLKLKAFIDVYKRRYTRGGIDFPTMNYLLEKITALRDRSVENFPCLIHDETPPQPHPAETISEHEQWPYKWLSFRRGWSWFILPYAHLDVYLPGDDESEKIDDSHVGMSIDGRTVIFDDLLAHMRTTDEPVNYLISAGENANYIVSQMGKKIFARYDFISPKIKPFSGNRHYPLSPGRVRLFGLNHLVIRNSYRHETASII
ncbi:MAG TPA: hypothetical protein PK926_11270 [Spirochaetota bacterium]|nr:hypothetical protein [Spirochaetota bacterium]HPI88283.1 hypothetical protein [Spirochaetota bacterium]HPR47747.1 hypothetical protein [Spirochaetota bacterium]